MQRITATEAARNFSRILDQARDEGETFVVERNGEALAEIRPLRRKSLKDALELFRDPPDPEWGRDVEGVLEQTRRRPAVPRRPA